MNSDTITIIGVLISLIAATATAIRQLRSERANAINILQDAAGKQVKRLNGEIEELLDRVRCLEDNDVSQQAIIDSLKRDNASQKLVIAKLQREVDDLRVENNILKRMNMSLVIQQQQHEESTSVDAKS